MKKENYRQDIQILRGISVLLVVFYHLKIPGFQNGFLGVDIFFVISGYLMAQLYNPDKKIDFFYRRARRLLPAYLSTIFLTILISFFILVPSDFKQLINQAKASLVLNPNIYFWNQDSYFAGTQFNPLLNLWSLGIEFQFYLIMPVISSIFIKSKKSLSIILIISIISCFVVLAVSPKTSFFLLPLRLWEFLIGYLAYKYEGRTTRANKLHLVKKITITIGVVSVLNLPIDVYGTSIYFGHPGVIATLIVVLTAYILTLKFSAKTRFWNSILEKIGNYSYSIYLVHLPIIILSNYQPFSGSKLGIENIRDAPAILVLIILFSAFIFNCLEDPLRKSKFDLKFIVIPFALIVILSNNLESLHNAKFSEREVKINYAFQDRSGYRCGKIFRLFNPTELVCSINNGSQNIKVLLLGNSHADSIKDTFVEVSKQYDVSLYFWVQNNPLMRDGADIDEVYNEIIEKKISHVFLHYSRATLTFVTLSNLLQKLSSGGVFVTILGPIPVWSNSIPYLMWNKDKFRGELTMNYEDYVQDNLDELNSIKMLLMEGTQYFDTAALFCNPICTYSNDDHEPYYWDSGHLTLTGARIINDPLNDIFKSYFGQSNNP
jgi:peptidoglycan/LPS O-acetylase OafA/YrhL